MTGGGSWRPTEAVELSADLRYESARWEDDLNTRRLSAGIQVDARAAWRFAENLEAFVAAENLFDANIEVGETADGVESYAAPQTIRVGFTYRR